MKQKRNSLIGEVKSELQKDAAIIDPGFIDCRIDELYALEGLAPPKLDDVQLRAAARTVQARAAWRRRSIPAKHALKRRLIRGTMAACFSALLFFSANYVSILITRSCLLSKAGITICCGTKFCLCDPDKMKETGHYE